MDIIGHYKTFPKTLRLTIHGYPLDIARRALSRLPSGQQFHHVPLPPQDASAEASGLRSGALLSAAASGRLAAVPWPCGRRAERPNAVQIYCVSA